MNYYDHMRQTLRLLIPLLLACNFSAPAQSATPPETPVRSSALDSSLFYQLLLGELNAQAQEPAAAFSLLLDAARKTSDESLYRRAVEIALRARSGDSALQAANAWREDVPGSLEANRYVLQILLNLNRLSATQEPLKSLLTLTPKAELVDTIWAIPSLFEHASDKPLAASLVQNALAPMMTDPALGATAWAALGRMWVNAGDTAKALQAAEKGQGFQVHQDHPAWLALALMRSDVNGAENLVKNYLANVPSTDFRTAYVQTLLLAQRNAEAKAELRNINQQQPDYAPAWLMQGAIHLQLRDWNTAESHFLKYLVLMITPAQAHLSAPAPRGLSQAYLSLAQIAVQRKDLTQAQVWLQRVDHPDDRLAAQLRRAGLMAQQGKVEEALSLIDGLQEQSHADIRLKRSTKVEILRDQKQFARARRLLEEALADNPGDTDILYDLAMLAEKMGDIDEMERLLRQLILAKPDDPQAYNALGYALADRNLRLPEARQLIEKALALAPGDSFIVDSLAWVTYRMGQTKEALELLRSAYSQRPDTEIAAHLGELLWVSGQRDEALQIWREGFQTNPDNETLNETLQRLRVTL